MKVIAKLTLLSAIFGLVACKPESQLDLTTFDISSKADTAALNGYVITEQDDLLTIPDDYIQLHKLSEHLITEHWLQNPNFLNELSELMALFKKTRLPEANVFIASLEASKQRYLASVDNADLIARSVQRKLDKKLECLNRSIEELEQKIRLLQTPEETYNKKISALNEEIKKYSRQYRQLNSEFHQSLQRLMAEHDPGIRLIDDIKFDYNHLPHSICSQYKGMSELLTTAQDNCVYINRDQLVLPFPPNLKEHASEIVDSYAPRIWYTMTHLNGYFDTVENKQYFADNLNNQLALLRKAVREKELLSKHETTALIERYQEQLITLKKQRDEKINKEYLNQHQRIDTSSAAFINRFCTAEPPIQPFAKVYQATDTRLGFIKAYAEKILREYPANLHFVVSEDGFFTIPVQKEANKLIIDFSGANQFIAYSMVKRSELPYIIKSQNKNATVVPHSLIAELDLKLRHYWPLL